MTVKLFQALRGRGYNRYIVALVIWNGLTGLGSNYVTLSQYQWFVLKV